MNRLATVALAAGLTLGSVAVANAQAGAGGGAGSGASSGTNTGAGTNMSGQRRSGVTTNRQGGSNQNNGTVGQGQRRDGPGASEFAPGRNPGTANKTNPGHGGTPPGQQMKKENERNNRR